MEDSEGRWAVATNKNNDELMLCPFTRMSAFHHSRRRKRLLDSFGMEQSDIQATMVGFEDVMDQIQTSGRLTNNHQSTAMSKPRLALRFSEKTLRMPYLPNYWCHYCMFKAKALGRLDLQVAAGRVSCISASRRHTTG